MEDRHAIDLLLERPDGSGKLPVEIVFARSVQGKFEERLDSVEKILDVLSAMPAPEPSPDLVSRTLQRIEEAQLEPSARNSAQNQLPPDNRTHA